jgi:hypothetical protein
MRPALSSPSAGSCRVGMTRRRAGRTGGSRASDGLARHFEDMSVQPNGAIITSAVAEISPRGAVRRGRPDVAGRRDGELPDPLVDELADRLSILLADRLADRLLVRMADVASRVQEEDDTVPRIPEGARRRVRMLPERGFGTRTSRTFSERE